MPPSLLGKCRGYVSSELGNLMSHLGKEASTTYCMWVILFLAYYSLHLGLFAVVFFFHKKIINSRSYNSVFQVSESVYHRANYLQFSSPWFTAGWWNLRDQCELYTYYKKKHKFLNYSAQKKNLAYHVSHWSYTCKTEGLVISYYQGNISWCFYYAWLVGIGQCVYRIRESSHRKFGV